MQRILRILMLAFLSAAAPITAQAQDYPTRQIHLIVPLPPGGGVDAVARPIAQKLGEALGQQVIIENRPGASGTLGAQVVAKAQPDGYTLLFSPGDFVTQPSLMPRMAFDPYKDLIPVTMVTSNPLVVVATAKAPFNNLKEMIAYAKTSAVSLGYAIPGAGTVNHVAGEWLAAEAGIKLQNIPYRGGPAAVNDVVSGTVPLAIVSPPPVQGLVDTGKLKMLALTGKRRPAYLPASWPTLMESGLPIDATLWLGVFAPAGTPDAIVRRIDQAIVRILQDDGVRRRMNDTGTEPEPVSLEAFAERIRADAERYERIIRQAGIKIEK